MSANKQTVQSYLSASGENDHAALLACLTDDVEWIVPGSFLQMGKPAFEHAIDDDEFIGTPAIRTDRLTEQDDVVIAEGWIRRSRKHGGMMIAAFCYVFAMQDGKIKSLTSYLAELKR